MTLDPVSGELRAIEREVDRAYAENPLVALPRGEAIWYFLAACEEVFVAHLIHRGDQLNEHHDRALADGVINAAKWPMRWLSNSCSPGLKTRPQMQEDTYTAAWELSDLADDYSSYEYAYSFASWGLVDLTLEGSRIKTSGPLREDTRWEAYDHIADLHRVPPPPPELVDASDVIQRSVRVQGSQFSYDLNPRLVSRVAATTEAYLEPRFTLPLEWQLTSYSLGEYKAVLSTIWNISAIHFLARMSAAMQGCQGLGYDAALVLMSPSEVRNRLVRYTGIQREHISEIVTDLTYGSRQIAHPDPALQPIVELSDELVGWAPNLVLSSSLERNLIVLMNRLPEGRDAYSRLSHEKETRLRALICEAAEGLGYRTWFGNVPGWSASNDIDLAIISDRDKHCLVLELKAFVAPADPREVRQKSDEIARGIEQIRTRRESFRQTPDPLLELLGATPGYEVTWVVGSETSIGGGWVQADDVPVIRVSHLLTQLRADQNLKAVCDWLTSREYLPVQGRDYRQVEIESTVSGWTLEWFGIEGLQHEGD